MSAKKDRKLFILKRINALILTSVILSGAITVGGNAAIIILDNFTEAVGDIVMLRATPGLDGIIADGEWGTPGITNDNNTYSIGGDYGGESVITSEIYFSYDDDNMYIAADINDPDVRYSTGTDTLDLARNGKNVYGYNGDVFVFALDPLGEFLANGYQLFDEYNAWLCVSMDKNGDICVYRTRFGDGDITSRISGKAQLTETGWRFELSVPWSLTAESVDLASYTAFSLDEEGIKTPGTVSRAEVIYVDRFYDLEREKVATSNLYATCSVYTPKGVYTPSTSSGAAIIHYGIDIITADSEGNTGDYVSPKELVPDSLWENTYNDISESAWYFDAVGYVCEAGYFRGTSYETFEPDTAMTRGMLITLLARLADADVDKYIPSTFDDVPIGSWYAKSIEWAYEKGIVNGYSDTKFGPDDMITREQLVTAFYRFCEYKGYRTDGVTLSLYEEYSDAAACSSYAKEAFAWAAEIGLIQGMDGLLNPHGSANRAQAARIIENYSSVKFTRYFREGEKLSSLTIAGNSISEYVIVYAASDSKSQTAASDLVEYVEKTTGDVLPVYADTAFEAVEKEILIGATNRENADFVIDRTDMGVEGLVKTVKDSKLSISGGEIDGTRFGVFDFLEKQIGWVFANNDCESLCYAESIDIPEGFYEMKNPQIDNLTFFNYKPDDWTVKSRLPGKALISDDAFQASAAFLYSNCDWDYYIAHNRSPQYCYTDPEVIAKIEQGLYTHIEKHTDLDMYCVTQNDSAEYCQCENCLKVYREEGSTAGTLIRMQNYLAEKVKVRYPDRDIKIMIMAYDFTTHPPKTPAADNIILRTITITMCFQHALNDPACPINASIYKDYCKWRENVSNIYCGDHGNVSSYYLIPVADFDMIYENMTLYSDWGYKGFIYWGDEYDNVNTVGGGYAEMRSYLLSKFFWEKGMTREEYLNYREKYLESMYGAGWSNILEYQEKNDRLQNYGADYGTKCSPESVYDEKLYLNTMGELSGLWQNALDAVDSDSIQYYNIQRVKSSFDFMNQVFTYNRDYVNGNELTREAYKAANRALYNKITTYKISWSEVNVQPTHFSEETSPSQW